MRGVEQIPWIYDAMMVVIEATGLKSWRSWLVAGARGRTLDVGCGTGRNLTLYGEARPIGVDPSFEALTAARRRAPELPLVQARVEALPFKPGVFDTVVSGLVFCSVKDPPAGLAEVERVLAPGGTLRMLEHVRSDSTLEGRWQDFIQPLWTKVAGGCHPNRRTEQTLEAAGFAVSERRAKSGMRQLVASPPASMSGG